MEPTHKSSLLSDLLVNILIGAGDGLMIPSALLAVMTAAGAASSVITTTALIATSLAAIVMGTGGYYTRKSAGLQPKNPVRDEMNSVTGEKTRAFFANLGMDEQMQQQAISEMGKDDDEWKNFMARYDPDPAMQSPIVSGFVIGVSYFVAGMLALTPYFFQATPPGALLISVSISLPLLFVLGLLKGRLTGQRSGVTAITLLVTGALTIGAAYLVTTLFIRH